MARYAHEAPILGERASREALVSAGVAAPEITHLVTVSCTGFFAPGLDVALIERLGLSPTVSRTHVGFMGCHAALNALAVATALIAAHPKAKVLLCCVELCTLHFGYGFTPDRIIANSLFADGAAATVIAATSSDAPFDLVSTATRFLPGTKHAMTWNIGNHGYEMTLSAEVPALIGDAVRPWLETWLPRHELAVESIPHWAIHPGGPKVLASSAAALGLDASALAHSHHILAKHGNMSSATLLFILNQIKSPGHIVSLGFGPGLMMEGALLRRN
jgi:predicted naringenin-chalcone synthase